MLPPRVTVNDDNTGTASALLLRGARSADDAGDELLRGVCTGRVGSGERVFFCAICN